MEIELKNCKIKEIRESDVHYIVKADVICPKCKKIIAKEYGFEILKSNPYIQTTWHYCEDCQQSIDTSLKK